MDCAYSVPKASRGDGVREKGDAMRYEIMSEAYPVVVCYLDAGERMQTERGSMVWMDPWIDMTTEAGGLEGVLGRMLTGEQILQNVYTARQPGKIAFGSSFPGRILPVGIAQGRDFIVQKDGFLAAEAGVKVSPHINQRVGGGYFGGEGFIMQRLSGNGTAFIEVDGDLVNYELGPGQQLVVDTGSVLGFTASVTLDIQMVHGAMNLLFGGEGVFNTVLTGPGTVWLQTMPMSSMANALLAAIRSNKNKRR